MEIIANGLWANQTVVFVNVCINTDTLSPENPLLGYSCSEWLYEFESVNEMLSTVPWSHFADRMLANANDYSLLRYTLIQYVLKSHFICGFVS